MDIEKARKESLKKFEWKNISPLVEALKNIKILEAKKVEIGDIIKIYGEKKDASVIKETALKLRPWRKGPFEVFSVFIDSEWRSYIKYNILKPFFNIK